MKIGFTGTISVGKTTLVKELQKLPEFKNYEFFTERSKMLRDMGIPLDTDSTLKGQCVFLSERARELFHENMMTDRTVIDVMAFANSAKSINFIDAHNFNNLAASLIKEYDYIFYVSPDGVKLEDNGVRCVDSEYRDKIDFQIQKFINQYRYLMKNYTLISGSTENRIKQVKQSLGL